MGKATSAPAARAISASPTWPGLSGDALSTVGMREIQEASVTPLTKKTAAIANHAPR